MSKLDRYANASAGKREERIFLVFAKLNTKRSFSAFDLINSHPLKWAVCLTLLL